MQLRSHVLLPAVGALCAAGAALACSMPLPPPEPEEPEPEIYPLRGAAPPPREAPPTKPRAAVPPPPPEAGDVFPLPSRKHVPAERSEGTAVSAWVSTILSALVLGAAVGLGVYTFGRPFLQR